MNAHRTISLLTAIAASVAVAAICAGTASAEAWPWHSGPGASPCYVISSGGTVVSPMPAVERRRESIGTVYGGNFSLGTPAPDAVSTSGYDEWIYYRIVAYTQVNGTWVSYPGNWTAALNNYTGAGGLWEYLGGRWVWIVDGDSPDIRFTGSAAPGSVINDLPKGRRYQIWAELVWGAFGSYAALGPQWTYIQDDLC
jgi:hypothetical protein